MNLPANRIGSRIIKPPYNYLLIPLSPPLPHLLSFIQQKATELCPTSYKAWHSWARMNNYMVEELMGSSGGNVQGRESSSGAVTPQMGSPGE